LWANPSAKRPTPQWVIDKGAVTVYSAATDTEIPLFWDPIYKKYSRRFLREVARKFDGDPNLLFIDVTPGAETNPYRGRLDSIDPNLALIFANTPASDGRTYSDDLWLGTLKEYMSAAATIFSRTPTLITLNRGSLAGHPSQFLEIGAAAVAGGHYVGQNGLSGSSFRRDTSRRRAFLEWGKRTKLYFEMVAAAGGATGTLMEVMQAAERIGADFLGVYGSDVLKGTPGQPDYDPAYEEALRYGASVVGQR